jgi:deferrochelatase/peroxidase EfeB
LCVQACADDPQVAIHAVRNLAALGRGTVTVRWVQQGFRSAPAAYPKSSRNLLGFKDGTNNLDPTDERLMAQNIWVGPDDEPAWMRGGTYMVVRRIRMRIEHWDSVSLEEQERTFGRRKVSGAPFGWETESDPVDPAQLPPDCHIIQANPRTPGSETERILRRSYSFSDGFDMRFGELDAGLFFICFQRDPRRQFIPIQTRLAENDHLSEYTFHTGSAIFAIPPGVREGEYVGQTLLEAL